MANLQAIYSVGNSLVTYLDNSYQELSQIDPLLPSCKFQLLSSIELDDMDKPNTTLSLFLHRVTIDEHVRNAHQINAMIPQQAPLSLDLHYLMSIWANSAATEHFILAWAMRQLHLHPLLDSSYLSSEADWRPEEVIQIIPAELSNEDMMRIWDTLKPSYRLSVSYIARVVRIEGDELENDRPVVATRMLSGERQEVMP